MWVKQQKQPSEVTKSQLSLAGKKEATMCLAAETKTGQGQVGSSITIRHFRTEDEDAVKNLFAPGIMSNANAGFMKMCGNPVIIGAFGSLIAVTAKVTRSVVAAFLVEILAVGLFYGISRFFFSSYVKQSLQDDLSNINKVYVESGGCFLVATNPNTGAIVGTVGGQGKGKHMFELRRMSVHPENQGTGLGKKLLQRLEKECKSGKMTLTTTNIQYAAHFLYRRNGFLLTRKFPMMSGIMKYIFNIEIYEFVKDFGTPPTIPK